MTSRRALPFILTLLATPAPAISQDKVITATRTESVIRIDGSLDDEAWASAPVVSAFTQRLPTGGAPATQPTQVRVLYDNTAIFVAFRLGDSAPDSIEATLARRDFGGHSDWAHVYIDSYLDRRSAFRFSVNPAGVKSDAAIGSDDIDEDQAGWDAVWDAAARRDSTGWTAEFRIPLTQLRFSSNSGPAGQTWGVQFGRFIARRGEMSLWAATPPDVHGFVSRFGELRGLDVRSGRRLETIPYVLGRLTREPGTRSNPFFRQNRVAASVGADLRYGLTTDLTLTATINPDFGQVEADPSEVNLTGLETFLTEKRPFFVEGADIFQLQMSEASWLHGTEDVFYSRRVGRAVQGRPPSDVDYVDFEPAARIVGAGKISGKTSSGWSVGLLNAITATEHAEYVAANDSGRVVIEPRTAYSVLRLNREALRGRAAIGSVFTATNRSLGDQSPLLPASAYVGGFDGRLRFGPRLGWDLSGSILTSRLGGEASAIDVVRRNPVHRHQRPDAEHLDYSQDATSLAGYSATASVGKNDGRWRGSLGGHVVSPGFDANDLGYHTVTDLSRAHLLIGYQDLRPALFRRWWGWWNTWSSVTHGGERTGLGTQVNGNVEFHNLWFLAGSIRRDQTVLSPTILRGGPALRLPGRTRGALSLSSDPRRSIAGTLSASRTVGDEGEGVTRFAQLLTIRPSPRADISLNPAVQWTRDPAQWLGQWIHNGSPVHLTGGLDQVTASLTARLNLSFTRDISLQLYAQPFSSEGRYGTLREVADPRSRNFAERLGEVSAQALPGGAYAIDRDGDGQDDFSIADPAFDVKELKANVVMRWEMRPGSAVFLVWSQGRNSRLADPRGDDDIWTDARDLFRLPATNVLLLKVSTWVGW
ncbi:MAG: DUF5916 domain-containing protein [Gemmatimonadaceae bacterium]